MTKKILLIFTIVFFAGMLFLSLFAEKIHRNSLPKVSVSRPARMTFPYEVTDENGDVFTITRECIAVPKESVENGIFVLYTAEKNGTKRALVRLAAVQTGAESDGYVEIVSGITSADRIVTAASEPLTDGAEVDLL